MIGYLVLACASSDNGDSRPSDSAPDSETALESDDTGEIGPPVDADADGYLAPEDCDDGDSRIYPGATDGCDSIDQDCDGALTTDGACGEPVELDGLPLAKWHLDDFGALPSPTAFDTDEPCVLAITGGPDPYGSLAALCDWDGALEEARPDWKAKVWTSGREVTAYGASAGDFDGDGLVDAAVLVSSTEMDRGGLYVFSSPVSSWGTSASYVDAAWAGWVDDDEGASFGDYPGLSAGGDLDGDGLSEALVIERTWVEGWGYEGETWIFFGGDPGLHSQLDGVSLRSRAYESGTWEDRSDGPWLAPDLDSDGMDDLLGCAVAPGGAGEGGFTFGSGAEVREDDGAFLEDVLTFEVVEGRQAPCPAGRRMSPGDLDGDGVDDVWAVGGYFPDDDLMNLSVFDGASIGDRREVRVLAGVELPTGFGLADDSHDVDGDGLYDLTATVHESPCIFPTSRLQLDGLVLFEDIALCFVMPEGAASGTMALSDLDGDGSPEAIIRERFEDETTDGWWVVPAISDFPWDDPTRW